jgi:hydrogenase expression/formation protein HypD
MEVCGTHTVSAFRCGLHSVLPENVKLLSGPGCPVCVTSQGQIDQLIQLARSANLTLCTYGDMLRVTGSDGDSLETARSRGGSVKVIYSAMDAVKLAASDPNRDVVFIAVGFETTTPATAVAVQRAKQLGLKNFSAFVSHKLVLPAMRALLRSEDVRIDGFLAPGHVSVIIGSHSYQRIVQRYRKPCVVVGFEDVQMAQGLALLTEMINDARVEIVNLYPQAVSERGNSRARAMIDSTFRVGAVPWRGLGRLPHSGLILRDEFRAFDACERFEIEEIDVPEPAGCRCGDVITGRCTPAQCGLFARVCTPINPIGPCMVSSEGTCGAWFKYARGHESREGALA